jgi:hypothetical protein
MNLSKSLTMACSIISEEKVELSASMNSPLAARRRGRADQREQHRPQFLAHLVEELGADPRTFAADDLRLGSRSDDRDRQAWLPYLGSVDEATRSERSFATDFVPITGRLALLSRTRWASSGRPAV